MALYSDMNGFPESGFPVLADMEDRIVLNTLYYNPLKHLGYKIDVVGNVRFLGNAILGGTLTGVTSITMAGALSGATTIGASGVVTLSGGNLVMTTGNILMTSGEIGSLLARIKKAWLKDLHIENRPSCGAEDGVALVSDLRRLAIYSNIPYDIDFGFSDFVLGTAKTYILDLKAKRAYTIDGIVLKCDTGTLDVTVRINGVDVTTLSSVNITDTIAETTATGANTVALGDLVTLEFSTGYTGTPTIFDGKLLRTLV